MKHYPLYTHGKSLFAIIAAIPIVFLLVGQAFAGGPLIDNSTNLKQKQKQDQYLVNEPVTTQKITYEATRDASAPSIMGGSFGFGAATAPGCPRWIIGRGKGGSLGGSVNISNSRLNSGGGLLSYGTNYALWNLICNNEAKMREAASISDDVALGFFQCQDPSWRAQKEFVKPGSCAGIPVIDIIAVDPEDGGMDAAYTMQTHEPAGTPTVRTAAVQRPRGCEIYQPCWNK